MEVELARTERRMGYEVAGRGVDGHEFSRSVVADNDTQNGGPRERDCGRIDPLLPRLPSLPRSLGGRRTEIP